MTGKQRAWYEFWNRRPFFTETFIVLAAVGAPCWVLWFNSLNEVPTYTVLAQVGQTRLMAACAILGVCQGATLYYHPRFLLTARALYFLGSIYWIAAGVAIGESDWRGLGPFFHFLVALMCMNALQPRPFYPALRGVHGGE